MSPDKRHKLGSWTLPSGNQCDVYLTPVDKYYSDIYFEWDDVKLTKEEQRYYLSVVQPEVTRRAMAYLEILVSKRVLL